MLRIRFLHEAVPYLGFTIERLADGLFYQPQTKDWAAGVPSGALTLAPVATSGPWSTVYRASVDSAAWPDGEYAVYVSNAAGVILPDGILRATLKGGDDSPVWMMPAGGAVNVTLPPTIQLSLPALQLTLPTQTVNVPAQVVTAAVR